MERQQQQQKQQQQEEEEEEEGSHHRLHLANDRMLPAMMQCPRSSGDDGNGDGDLGRVLMQSILEELITKDDPPAQGREAAGAPEEDFRPPFSALPRRDNRHRHHSNEGGGTGPSRAATSTIWELLLSTTQRQRLSNVTTTTAATTTTTTTSTTRIASGVIAQSTEQWESELQQCQKTREMWHAWMLGWPRRLADHFRQVGGQRHRLDQDHRRGGGTTATPGKRPRLEFLLSRKRQQRDGQWNGESSFRDFANDEDSDDDGDDDRWLVALLYLTCCWSVEVAASFSASFSSSPSSSPTVADSRRSRKPWEGPYDRAVVPWVRDAAVGRRHHRQQQPPLLEMLVRSVPRWWYLDHLQICLPFLPGLGRKNDHDHQYPLTTAIMSLREWSSSQGGGGWVQALAQHLGWSTLVTQAVVAEKLLLVVAEDNNNKSALVGEPSSRNLSNDRLLSDAIWQVLPAGSRFDTFLGIGGGGSSPSSSPCSRMMAECITEQLRTGLDRRRSNTRPRYDDDDDDDEDHEGATDRSSASSLLPAVADPLYPYRVLMDAHLLVGTDLVAIQVAQKVDHPTLWYNLWMYYLERGEVFRKFPPIKSFASLIFPNLTQRGAAVFYCLYHELSQSCRDDSGAFSRDKKITEAEVKYVTYNCRYFVNSLPKVITSDVVDLVRSAPTPLREMKEPPPLPTAAQYVLSSLLDDPPPEDRRSRIRTGHHPYHHRSNLPSSASRRYGGPGALKEDDDDDDPAIPRGLLVQRPDGTYVPNLKKVWDRLHGDHHFPSRRGGLLVGPAPSLSLVPLGVAAKSSPAALLPPPPSEVEGAASAPPADLNQPRLSPTEVQALSQHKDHDRASEMQVDDERPAEDHDEEEEHFSSAEEVEDEDMEDSSDHASAPQVHAQVAARGQQEVIELLEDSNSEDSSTEKAEEDGHGGGDSDNDDDEDDNGDGYDHYDDSHAPAGVAAQGRYDDSSPDHREYEDSAAGDEYEGSGGSDVEDVTAGYDGEESQDHSDEDDDHRGSLAEELSHRADVAASTTTSRIDECQPPPAPTEVNVSAGLHDDDGYDAGDSQRSDDEPTPRKRIPGRTETGYEASESQGHTEGEDEEDVAPSEDDERRASIPTETEQEAAQPTSEVTGGAKCGVSLMRTKQRTFSDMSAADEKTEGDILESSEQEEGGGENHAVTGQESQYFQGMLSSPGQSYSLIDYAQAAAGSYSRATDVSLQVDRSDVAVAPATSRTGTDSLLSAEDEGEDDMDMHVDEDVVDRLPSPSALHDSEGPASRQPDAQVNASAETITGVAEKPRPHEDGAEADDKEASMKVDGEQAEEDSAASAEIESSRSLDQGLLHVAARGATTSEHPNSLQAGVGKDAGASDSMLDAQAPSPPDISTPVQHDQAPSNDDTMYAGLADLPSIPEHPGGRVEGEEGVERSEYGQGLGDEGEKYVDASSELETPHQEAPRPHSPVARRTRSSRTDKAPSGSSAAASSVERSTGPRASAFRRPSRSGSARSIEVAQALMGYPPSIPLRGIAEPTTPASSVGTPVRSSARIREREQRRQSLLSAASSSAAGTPARESTGTDERHRLTAPSRAPDGRPGTGPTNQTPASSGGGISNRSHRPPPSSASSTRSKSKRRR